MDVLYCATPLLFWFNILYWIWCCCCLSDETHWIVKQSLLLDRDSSFTWSTFQCFPTKSQYFFIERCPSNEVSSWTVQFYLTRFFKLQLLSLFLRRMIGQLYSKVCAFPHGLNLFPRRLYPNPPQHLLRSRSSTSLWFLEQSKIEARITLLSFSRLESCEDESRA